jgi:transcriptional regulator with XRE-family HTH domain
VVTMTLGDRLSYLRENKGLTQPELAGLVKLSRSSLSHYETSRREPNFATLIRLADFFGVSTDYLVTGKTVSCTTTLEITDTERFSKVDLKVDGIALSIDDVKTLIAFVRADRTFADK